MKSYLEKNLKLLAKSFPGIVGRLTTEKLSASLQIVYSKKGQHPVPVVFGRAWHSRVDPITEGVRKIKLILGRSINRIFFTPADFLYGLEAFFEQAEVNPRTQFYLLFKDISFFKSLCEHRDLSFLQAYLGQVSIFFIDELDFEAIDFNLPYVKGSHFFDVVGADLKLEGFKQRYQEKLKDYYASRATQFYFEKKWLQNIFSNLSLHFDKNHLIDVKGFKNKFKDQVAVLVGAGPSLSLTMDDLKRHKDKLFILASDTSLKPLLVHGIQPDIVISLDASFYNSWDFTQMPMKATILLADITTYCHIPRLFKGRLGFFYSKVFAQENQDNVGYHAIRHLGIEEYFCQIETGGSVGHTLFGVAEYFGFKQVVAMGMDMASPFFDSHIYCGAHFDYFYKKSDRLDPVASQDFAHMVKKLTKVEERRGENLLYLENNMMKDPEIYKKFDIPTKLNYSPLGRMMEKIGGLDSESFILQVSALNDKKRELTSTENVQTLHQPIPFDFLKKAMSGYIEKIEIFLTKIEKKEITTMVSLEEALEDLIKSSDQFTFLNSSMTFFSLSAERRQGENPFLKAHIQYSEMRKMIYFLLKKSIFA